MVFTFPLEGVDEDAAACFFSSFFSFLVFTGTGSCAEPKELLLAPGRPIRKKDSPRLSLSLEDMLLIERGWERESEDGER